MKSPVHLKVQRGFFIFKQSCYSERRRRSGIQKDAQNGYRICVPRIPAWQQDQ